MSSFFCCARRSAKVRPKTERTRLYLESLESREVPATFMVTSTADDGAGTLRDAVRQANTNPNSNNSGGAADVIQFASANFPAATMVSLTSGSIVINDSVNIVGPGVANALIDGTTNLVAAARQRLFTIDSTLASNGGAVPVDPAAVVSVTISGLTLRNGAADSVTGGGAILNTGENLTLVNVEVENNSNGGSFGSGGAINSVNGTLMVRQSAFVGNRIASAVGNVAGNAINIDGGTATIENTTFDNNDGPGISTSGAVNIRNGANVTLRNNTFTGNDITASNAPCGAGVNIESSAGGVVLTGNILFGNTSTTGVGSAVAALDLNAQAPDKVSNASMYNDIGVIFSGATAGTANAPVLTPSLNNNISADPMLGALTVQSTGTKARTPAAAVVIDKIPAASAPSVDQRGATRPVETMSDMGSIETGGTGTTIITPSTGGDSTTPPGMNPGGGGVGGTTSPGTTTGSGTATTTAMGTATSSGTAASTGTSSIQQGPDQIINQLVVANLQKVFGQPLPPQIGLATIVGLQDVNGDGFNDVTALVGIRVRLSGGRFGIQLFLLTFDGLSSGGALIGQPRLLGTLVA